MRRDFAKISREIRTAQPHVPEDCLTASRGISRERTQKIPQARLNLRTPVASVSGAQEHKKRIRHGHRVTSADSL